MTYKTSLKARARELQSRAGVSYAEALRRCRAADELLMFGTQRVFSPESMASMADEDGERLLLGDLGDESQGWEP